MGIDYITMNEQKIRTIEDIISAGRANLPNDEARNAELVADHIRLGIRPHGCVLDKNSRNHPEAAVWKTVIFIGGAQRVIARGTLYQCARVYDVALLRWAPYRTRHHVDFSDPASFNFNKEQAGRDSIHADFVLHFGNLEECWQRDGVVLSAQPSKEKIEEPSRIRSTDRQTLDRIEAKLDEQIALLHKVVRWFDATPTTLPSPSKHAEPTAPPASPTEESFNGTTSPDIFKP
jgi:hypothetical protein